MKIRKVLFLAMLLAIIAVLLLTTACSSGENPSEAGASASATDSAGNDTAEDAVPEPEGDLPAYDCIRKVRLAGTQEWVEAPEGTLPAQVGDQIEFQMEFRNTSENDLVESVAMRIDALPEQLQYVSGSAALWDADYPDGLAIQREDALFGDGGGFGKYAPGANFFVRFTAEVVGELPEGGCTATAVISINNDATFTHDYPLITTQ